MSGTAPTAVDGTNFTPATDAQVSGGLALVFGVKSGTENTPTPVGLTLTPQQLAQLVPSGSGGYVENPNQINSAFVVSANTNAALIGPIAITSGGSITVSSGSVLKVM